MPEEESIDGKIVQVNKWKNGKGYFVKLDSLDQDFFKFGGFSSVEGELVRLHYKQGTGTFSDKFEIQRTEILVEGAEPKPVPKKIADFSTRELPEKPEIKKDDLASVIRRSVTIKCATTIIAARIAKGPDQNISMLADNAKELAKELEDYIEKG